MARSFLESLAVPEEIIDFNKWPSVLDDIMSDKDRLLFNRRKNAIEMYLIGSNSMKQIHSKTGICKKEIYRLLARCLQVDNDGQIWGFRALIPNKRIKLYTISSVETISYPGKFQAFLIKYPEIEEKIKSLFFKKPAKYRPSESIMQPVYIWKYFMDACRAMGIKPSEYPFNTKDKCRRAIERYLKELENAHYGQASKRYGKDVARHARVTGQGGLNYPIIAQPFAKVQFDGHRINAVFAIEFETPEGYTVVKVMKRPWLLLIIDIATRCVLGWSISFNDEYTAADVLACIRKSLEPWKPMNFVIPELKYPENGGYPSGVYKEAQWAAWDEFMFDNGKANLAGIVIERLKRITGCAVNPGPVETPERRNIIERLFGMLSDRGYNRLPSTVGQGPKDPRRYDAIKNAVNYHISYKHLFELTEVIIALYNGTPHGGICHLSPLEALGQRIEQGYLIRQIPESIKKEISFLSYRAERTVCGNNKQGKRPYINFEGVVYRNEVLSNSMGLIGQCLTLVVDAEDLRFIRAYLADGSELGLLRASGKWGEIRHSLKTRKEINALKERKVLHFTLYDDPIQVYLEFLAENAKKDRASASKIARIKEETNIKSITANSSNASLNESDISKSQTSIKNKHESNVITKNTDNKTKNNSQTHENGTNILNQQEKEVILRRTRTIVF